jgi:hypothetical protein
MSTVLWILGGAGALYLLTRRGGMLAGLAQDDGEPEISTPEDTPSEIDFPAGETSGTLTEGGGGYEVAAQAGNALDILSSPVQFNPLDTASLTAMPAVPSQSYVTPPPITPATQDTLANALAAQKADQWLFNEAAVFEPALGNGMGITADMAGSDMDDSQWNDYVELNSSIDKLVGEESGQLQHGATVDLNTLNKMDAALTAYANARQAVNEKTGTEGAEYLAGLQVVQAIIDARNNLNSAIAALGANAPVVGMQGLGKTKAVPASLQPYVSAVKAAQAALNAIHLSLRKAKVLLKKSKMTKSAKVRTALVKKGKRLHGLAGFKVLAGAGGDDSCYSDYVFGWRCDG